MMLVWGKWSGSGTDRFIFCAVKTAIFVYLFLLERPYKYRICRKSVMKCKYGGIDFIGYKKIPLRLSLLMVLEKRPQVKMTF